MKHARFPALLLALLALTACASDAPAPIETDAVTTAAEPLEAAPPLRDFVITRGDNAEGLIPTVLDLRERIKDLGGEDLTPRTDFVMPTLPEAACEILLGETVREASAAVYAKLAGNEWAVVREGDKIVIAAHGSEPLGKAINWFCANYFHDGKLVYPADAAHIETYAYQNWYDVLLGRSINLIGDSYVAHSSLESGRTWGVLLSEKYAMDYKGYGQGGNCIVADGGSGVPILERYKTMRSKADIVMVVGGRNDYNQRYPVGQVGDTTADTFAGAVGLLIDGLRDKYPDSLILFSTCWRVNDEQAKYAEAMMAVCAERGVPCFNAADESLSGVKMADGAFRADYCIKATDVSHLNDAGMKLVMPKYEKFIAEEAAQFFGE